MKYIARELGPIMTNCYVVYDTESKDAMVVDPAWDYPAIDKILTDNHLNLQLIFLTHGHADHIGALQELRQRKNVPVYVGQGDASLISNSHNNLSIFIGRPVTAQSADYFVKDGDQITVGNLHFTVLETPGHTPGGLSLYGEGVVFSGDTLFRFSVGRTDLYGGSAQVLLDSINNKLMQLPDSTLVLPGHGPATSIGDERRGNPFLDGGW